ncbi:hypothetical protein SAMN05421630_107186 [Prauserella marina]|uniref:Uncharacterized protein n=1 Tax=Prauserella marina TaxID=530584 RepID=A0A1G6TLP2_9PSEU|nr:hypothetical protein [Prauserella marina]PWV75637.1 hypothetical protein DES30_106254 [Prauserella marina]SDD29971.1 hypothetical protein SAMN05421630_107186 [Prauserella marina]
MGTPDGPLDLRLQLNHNRLWWRVDDEDHVPEHWSASVDLPGRHVADILLDIADLSPDRNLLDALTTEDPLLLSIAETALCPTGRLVSGLRELLGLSAEPVRMIIVRDINLESAWRGKGLGGALLAATLRTLSRTAQLAVCRPAASGFPERPDPLDPFTAELASLRVELLLESIGFRRWNGLHCINLRDPALLDTRNPFLTDTPPPWQ